MYITSLAPGGLLEFFPGLRSIDGGFMYIVSFLFTITLQTYKL